MKIKKVVCWLLRVPFKYFLRKDTFYQMVNFVEVETDDGLKGHAVADYPSMGYAIREFINREVAPAITGMDPMRIEEVRTVMFRSLFPKYFLGTSSCSASLIDIALWDIKGKATGQPVWKLLGGSHRQQPIYVTFGVNWYDKEELAEVAKMLVADGQDKLKMVVGVGIGQNYSANRYEWAYGHVTDQDIIRDVDRVQAVRDAVGDKVSLIIDGNRRLSYTQAFQLAKLLEPYNLAWFEDSLSQSDPRLMAHLRKRITVPLAAGSTGTSDLIVFREHLLHKAVDIIQPNVRDIGGYSGGLKAAALAQAFNVRMMAGGSWPHINMHLHAGVPNGGWVEFHWMAWHVVEALFDGAPPPINGWVTLPEAPGLGFTPKKEIVKDFAMA